MNKAPTAASWYRNALTELGQEAGVVFEEQPQVVDAITQHGELYVAPHPYTFFGGQFGIHNLSNLLSKPQVA